MSLARLLAGLLALGMLMSACGAAPSTGDVARINPELVAALGPEDAKAVSEAVNAFGFELLAELTAGRGNAVTSPLSVSALLAMVLAGAGSETAQAMQKVLHLDNPRDPRVGALLRELADTNEVTLSVSNALWANKGASFEQDYLDFVRDTFGATVEEADLGSQETADAIDRWVRERTEGRIEDIAADLGLPNPQALLVLLNAVYFLGRWTTPFDPAATRDESFTLADGSKVTVPLMHQRNQELGYGERDGYRVLRLPYGKEGRYGMEVFLPDEDANLETLLASLDAQEWRAAVDSLEKRKLDEIAMPRFELRWEGALTEPLSRLGMGVAFSPDSDFRPMSPADPWLDVVVHKTWIRVDENGTEAAAVTGGAMVTSAPLNPLVFRVDRPFAFAISDAKTGALLFLGAVADPRR